jgi:F420-non-reducing hydrogenase large subunit
MASTKAVDAVFGVEPTPAAKLVRQLHYNAFYVEDHYIHFFFLAAPDFVVGADADPALRNVLGLISKVGLEIGGKVIDIRKRCRDIIRAVFLEESLRKSGYG